MRIVQVLRNSQTSWTACRWLKSSRMASGFCCGAGSRAPVAQSSERPESPCHPPCSRPRKIPPTRIEILVPRRACKSVSMGDEQHSLETLGGGAAEQQQGEDNSQGA